MVPPRWIDEDGHPRLTRPCLKCGRDAPLYRFGLQDIRPHGWRLFAPASFVNWCWHPQPLIPIPERSGRVWLVPVVGEMS